MNNLSFFLKVTCISMIFIGNGIAYGNSECKDLVTASWEGRTDDVITMLKSNVDANCEYKVMSALIAASRFGKSWAWDKNIETVKVLVEYGANVNHVAIRNGERITPAYIAAFAGHSKTALYLVSKGGDMKEAEKGHEEYIKREQGSLNTLGLVASVGQTFLNSIGLQVPENKSTANSYNQFSKSFIDDAKNNWESDVQEQKPPSGHRIQFTNNCDQPLKLAINYKTTSGEWVTDGWWKFEPNEGAYLSNQRTNNAILYYYVKPEDGSRLNFKGEYAKSFEGNTLYMREIEDNVGDTEWSVTCN